MTERKLQRNRRGFTLTEVLLALAILIILLALVIILLTRKPAVQERQEDSGTIAALGTLVSQNLKEGRAAQLDQLSAMEKSLSGRMGGVTDQLGQFEKRLHGFTAETAQSLENIRAAVDKNLRALQEDNNRKLDDMRRIVDEKLQKTLSERMNESFKLVNERLEQVYKGLGEMQTLAQGVGDLKRVLTNVKTRGIVGEIQLGAILEDILAPEQYETNVATVPNSRNVVEYAVKLPVEDGSFVWLPIDSKFPGDTYGALRDAYEEGSREQIDACVKQLIATLKIRGEGHSRQVSCTAAYNRVRHHVPALRGTVRRSCQPRHGGDSAAGLPCQSGRSEHDGGAAEQPADVVPHDCDSEALG